MLTTIYAHDIMMLINSTHPNPHYILGMHFVDVPMDDKTRPVATVRAFLPDAKHAWVVDAADQKKRWPMERVHDGGVFEALIWEKKERFHYLLAVESHFGHSWTMEDPYEEWVEHVTQFDRHLFSTATHYRLYEKMGAHVIEQDGRRGVYFSVWAPNAARVSLIGDFNNWDGRKDSMELLHDAGVWVLFKPGMQEGDIYKYEIKTKDGRILEKADPYAFCAELRPKTASRVHTLSAYNWSDAAWIEQRAQSDFLNQPMSVYEVHMGSWRRKDGDAFLTYREMAEQMVPYVKDLGFTHIELMPVEEHPFDGSWGYQVTGYFAPTSRYGSPDDLKYFIDRCHQEGIGVILDWVPAHFPKDAHGLAEFDGTCLYEHADPRQGEHPDWGTKIFNFGRNEVKNFLISNALFWIDQYHFDGLRVDAVASMLYLDYGKKDGEWIANQYGGRENLEAIEFMKHLNSIVYQYYPGTLMMAEESTAWPNVSRPTWMGGLGFAFKWNMGWMHDILVYMTKDPVYRRYHHWQLTFGFLYAWSENFVLPFSHDEVTHGKGSMINKMPGDYWQKFANLRALYTYMWTHPGKVLLFMGQEFAQFDEWNEYKSLDWHLMDYDMHRGMARCVRDLNRIYREEPSLWQKDFTPDGFDGINLDDPDNSSISFMRRGSDPADFTIIAINFTPVPRYNYRLGVPELCRYREIFNSDAESYGGSNCGNSGEVAAFECQAYRFPYSLDVVIPPLGAVIFKPERG